MSEFISRRQLEVRHKRSYEMKERLKELGCEWDGIARAWIAPTLEVKELCYQILDGKEDEIIWHTSPGSHLYDWQMSNLSVEEFLGADKNDEVEFAPSITHSPNKQDAVNICGEDNVTRYWKDEISTEAAQILASGDLNWGAIYHRLEDAGWKSRSVTLLKDVVEFFRKHPPIPAIDNNEGVESLANPYIKPHQIDGSIGVICSKDGTPISFKVEFPYDDKKVSIIKSWAGRKWHSDKKYWEVPLIHARSLFGNFKYFQRSPKAAEIEKALEVK